MSRRCHHDNLVKATGSWMRGIQTQSCLNCASASRTLPARVSVAPNRWRRSASSGRKPTAVFRCAIASRRRPSAAFVHHDPGEQKPGARQRPQHAPVPRPHLPPRTGQKRPVVERRDRQHGNQGRSLLGKLRPTLHRPPSRFHCTPGPRFFSRNATIAV